MSAPEARRSAILHIGFPKTGTTAIQSALAAARPELNAAGFHFARAPGALNHMHLFALLREDGGPPPVAPTARAVAEAARRRPILPALAEELAALPDGVRSVIFSSEHLGGLVRSAEEVRRIGAALGPWFREFRVIAYLRRQDDYAVSDFSQALRGGLPRAHPLEAQPKDWWAMLAPWAEAFGEAAVTPRLHAAAALPGGDVLADFAAACGLPGLPAAPGAARANAGLDAPGQALVMALNRDLAARGVPAEEAAQARRTLLARLATIPPRGRGFLPARRDAIAFVARRAASNEKVRARWFPDRASLFSDDFSAWPEEAAAPPGAEDLLALALRLLAAPAPQPAGTES